MRVLLPWSGRRTTNSDCESCGEEETSVAANNDDEPADSGQNFVIVRSKFGPPESTDSSPNKLFDQGTAATARNPSEAEPQADTKRPKAAAPKCTTPVVPRVSKRRAEAVAAQNNLKVLAAKRSRPDSKPAARPEMAVGGGRRKVDEEKEDIEPSYRVTNQYFQPSENEPPPVLPNDPLRPGGAPLQETDVAAEAVQVEEPSLEDFRQALKQRGLDMIEQEGDGNCLFRAVSLQVYGQAENHTQVREQCLDFMARNEEHYSNFVAAEALSFQDYITLKRRDGVHGNHAEIQAISELFNRPVEVFKSPEEGGPIEPMNIFHAEYKTADPPIRLSYHNNNHYNAVVDPLVPTAGLGLGLPGLKPGLADKMQVTQAKAESDRMADEMELERVLKQSQADLKETEDDQLQRILKESTVDFMYKQKAMALSDLDATNFELEQKALAFSMDEHRNSEQGRKKRPARRRRPSPVMDQEPRVATSSSMFASIPTSAAASLPSAAAAAAAPPSPTLGTAGAGQMGGYPQAVEDLVMNGFELSKVLRAYDLVGDNFDDLLSFLLSSGGGAS